MVNNLLVLGLGECPSLIWADTSLGVHVRVGRSSAPAGTAAASTAAPVNAAIVSTCHIPGFFMVILGKSLCALRLKETTAMARRVLTST
jgi:hypothetical protein